MIKKIFLSIAAIVLISSGSFEGFSQPLPLPGPVPPPSVQQTPPPPPPGVSTPPPAVPAPPPPAAPWGSPGYLTYPPSSDWMNQGNLNVMATGYDTESVLVQIPLYITYSFNGVQYDITVLNAWNPYTQSWTVGIDTPAYQTSYYFNGFTYNWYVNLPTGTFYFNL